MEDGKGNVPCDIFVETAKHKTNQAVKIRKFVIPDGVNFCDWQKSRQ